MGLFLQIIGGIFIVVIILLILGIYLFFKGKFAHFFSYDEENKTPLAIHLNEDFSPVWLSDKKVKLIDVELTQLGFVRGKSYDIPEMQNIELTAYFKAPLTAVLYKHKVAGVWTDLVLEKTGKLKLTVSNAPQREAAEHRPEKKLEYLKEKSVTQLYEHIQAYIEEGVSYKVCAPDDFREYFEETYKKDMAYRARNGGMSFEEFLANKDELGKKVSDKDSREAFIITKEQELSQWSEVAIEEYTNSLSDREQDSLYDQAGLLIVPFCTDAEAFIGYLDGEGFIDNEDEGFAKAFKDETDIFKLFDRLNEGKSPELRAVLVSESNYPLQLKIYKHKYT